MKVYCTMTVTMMLFLKPCTIHPQHQRRTTEHGSIDTDEIPSERNVKAPYK